MELYPHNQRAYDRVVELFKSLNKTCIIHPTGTGKAVIVGKFIIDNPTKKHLLLAPGHHIRWEVRKNTGDVKFSFSTYQSTRNATKVLSLTGFDFIFLDEFHRIGAEIWGPMVMRIIEANPHAKVLGTTATPIRFLDDQRDMAFELFKSNIASYVTLNRAFLLGILLAPKYITAMYSIKEELARIEKKILESHNEKKQTLLKDLKKKVIDWEKSSGIDVILKKHISPSTKRIIVFCSTLDEMKTADGLLTPILTDIFGSVASLHIHSNYGRGRNRSELKLFNEESNDTKVLFNVDMMNEGLHGKDISTVILLRSTNSPTIFYQQIGRCFSVGQVERPVILDLVNNFKNIQLQGFQSDYEEEAEKISPFIPQNTIQSGAGGKEPVAIEFIDETQEIQEVFDVFSNQVEHWEIYFRKAEAYFDKYGHLYVSLKENDLCRWILSQRQRYRAGNLYADKVERLSKIGMDWERSQSNLWIENFNKLKAVIDEEGEEPMQMKDRKVRTWLYQQRERAAKGKLKEYQQKMLGSIVSLTGQAREQTWVKRVNLLREYKEMHGEFKCKTSDPIYPIIAQVRYAYNYGSLPRGVLEQIDELGLTFRSEDSWEKKFNLVKDHFLKHNTLPSQRSNKQLSTWVSHQRYRLRKNQLKEKYVTLLRQLGIVSN